MWFANQPNTTSSIGRITTAVTPGIARFTPASGAVGTTVTVAGAHLLLATGIAFNGTPAVIVSATATRIVTTVPTGATTGPVSVTTPAGVATSDQPFTVT